MNHPTLTLSACSGSLGSPSSWCSTFTASNSNPSTWRTRQRSTALQEELGQEDERKLKHWHDDWLRTQTGDASRVYAWREVLSTYEPRSDSSSKLLSGPRGRDGSGRGMLPKKTCARAVSVLFASRGAGSGREFLLTGGKALQKPQRRPSVYFPLSSRGISRALAPNPQPLFVCGSLPWDHSCLVLMVVFLGRAAPIVLGYL